MRSCDASAQLAAQMWIQRNFGVVNDVGHIASLCSHAYSTEQAQLHQYVFLIVLLNTRAYLPPNPAWHAQQNHSAPQGTSLVFADFSFR
jgi:hypothetical protein